MIKLTETYTWKQAAVNSKFDKLQVELDIVSFAIEGSIIDIYSLSEYAAVEGMKIFAQRIENNWQARKSEVIKNFPKFDFEKRFKLKIYDNKPIGSEISFQEFVGFDYENQPVNIRNYEGCKLAYALLEPPYGLNIEIGGKRGSDEYCDLRTKKFTALYRMFLDDFVLLSEYKKEDLVIYSWSDDWSSFFDAGKEWWGTYFWTVYNKKNNTIIVIGASESD